MFDVATYEAIREIVMAVTLLVTAITALIVAIRQHGDVKVNQTVLAKVNKVEHILDPSGTAEPGSSEPTSPRPDGSAGYSGRKPD